MDSIVQSTPTLTVIASIAVAIAGFSGVVVALTGKTTDSFDAVERLNLRILLQVSSFALLFSLVPLIAHRAVDSEMAWRISMLLYGFTHILDTGFFIVKAGRSGTPSRLQVIGPRIGFSIAVVQIALGLFGPVSTVEVFYLIVLIWHLAIAGMGFVNLTFASRE